MVTCNEFQYGNSTNRIVSTSETTTGNNTPTKKDIFHRSLAGVQRRWPPAPAEFTGIGVGATSLRAIILKKFTLWYPLSGKNPL